MARVIGRKILNYETVTSTSDLAREWADSGEPEGLVISAEQQTAGRGRMGRKWIVPSGTSVQFSVLLRPPLPAFRASSIFQMAALGVAAAVRELSGSSPSSPPRVTLKWPNDVLLNSKKCAGILMESAVQGDVLLFVILGVGLNVNYSMAEFPELAPFATTMSDVLGRSVDCRRVEEALLSSLDECYQRLCSGVAGELAIFEEWRSQLETLGKPVRVSTPTGIQEGIATDVDSDGSLILLRRGDAVRLDAGDVTILKDSDRKRFE